MYIIICTYIDYSVRLVCILLHITKSVFINIFYQGRKIRKFTVFMISNRGMAKATRSKRRKRNVPISLSSTDTYTAAEYLTSVLGSRTIAYIIALPPSFLFIVCLLLISMFLPFLGLYVHNAGHVPDLDAMMV